MRAKPSEAGAGLCPGCCRTSSEESAFGQGGRRARRSAWESAQAGRRAERHPTRIAGRGVGGLENPSLSQSSRTGGSPSLKLVPHVSCPAARADLHGKGMSLMALPQGLAR